MSRFIDLRKGLLAVVVAAMSVVAGQNVQADQFSYNDVNGVDVLFFNISEDTTSGEPMFGQPTVVGNTMDFDPVNFKSESASGEANIVDSQLTFSVMTTKPVDSILKVRFSERGDYKLTGLGDATAVASVSANVFWDVLEINNVPVGQSISGNDTLTFSPSNGLYVLGTTATEDIWIGELNLDVPVGTTKVRFTMDNTLATAASDSGTAFIAKKDGDIRIEILVPEPATASLGLLGVAGVILAARRRSA